MVIFRSWETMDWGNQAAHISIGAAVTALLIFGVGWILPVGMAHCLATMIMMTFAMWREVVLQHPNTCGEGCRTDLAGWMIGILIANGLASYLFFSHVS